MKTLYEVLNVDLVNEHTKARKLAVLNNLLIDEDISKEAEAAIASMDIPEDDDKHHWIQKFGRLAGADLLTLGKVQPEHMLAMANLGDESFQEAVKVATKTARSWNTLTVDAEKDLNQELAPTL